MSGERAGMNVPAHHLVGMDLSFTCTNCGGHTSITPPCIPAKTYPTPVPSEVAETTAGERCTTTSATYEDADGTVRCWGCAGIAHETTAGARPSSDPKESNMQTHDTTPLTSDDVDRAFADRLADALIAAMCKADPGWDNARAKEVRSHMRTALAATGVTHAPVPNRRDGLFAVNLTAATLRAHTWWNDRNACSCGEQPTCEPPYYFNAGGNTDWHALHVSERLAGGGAR